MDNLINTSNQTPIEIALGIDENGMTTARKLYSFLELRADNFSRWVKKNITENEFAIENEDYLRVVFDDETPTGGKIQREDYRLTAHFAKKLSMKATGERGEQAREYFTRLEEKAKQMVIDKKQLSPQLQLMNMLVENMSRQEIEQKRQAEQISKIEKKQDALTETFSMPSDAEDFQKWANRCLSRIAESSKFDRGRGRNYNYACARNESYDRLKRKWNCNLNDRVARARGRALERKPGISKTELNSINKLTVIANDKSLKPVYETVIKEMMIAYCVEVA